LNLLLPPLEGTKHVYMLENGNMLAQVGIIDHQIATMTTILDNILVTLLEALQRHIHLSLPKTLVLTQDVPFESHQAAPAVYMGAQNAAHHV
jgi:hypothetical protein